MSHCEFPAELKWGCITEIVTIVRSGSIDRAKGLDIAQHAGCFACCAIELFKSSPDVVIPDDDDEDPLLRGPSDEYICDTLEDCSIQARLMAADETTAIDWGMIFNTILPLLLQLIQRYIK